MTRRLAAFAAFATVVLIVAGGVVTNTDSGLACPDWPTCFGSVVPEMAGNVAVEHTHRLIATAVGLCTVALVVLSLRRRAWLAAAGCCVTILGAAIWAGRVKYASGDLPFAPVALVALGYLALAAIAARVPERHGRLAVAALAVVMFQGMLGGLTVLYRLPTLVLVMHLGTSMIFLSLMLVLALTAPQPGRALAAPMRGTALAAPQPGRALSPLPHPGARGSGGWGVGSAGGAGISSKALIWMTAGAVYLQIVLGATVRHTGAGLVCVDLPYCRGALWPADVHPMVHLHMAHRAFAFVVLALVAWQAVRLARETRGAIRALALCAPLLVLAQITLGVLTILTFKDLVPLTAHLLVGALLLACEVSLLALARAEPERAQIPEAMGVAA